ncbi:MAG TPA: HlyD family efflux transporter periplasmic adaptor subunit [Rhizomicrobium sp.]|jgi:membrane fusion protein (multidrug efflux system)|nr:HlyD family efflux transporter periplasmic adaptor subunit [Rhizomicrobium sp.]
MSDSTDIRAMRAMRRRKGFLLFGAAIILAGLAYAGWWLFEGRLTESTDDAYVAGNIVAVTSRENATVTALYADNTQAVRRGQLLIEMDPSVADVNMRAAEANLARAARSVRGTFASADSYSAQLSQAEVALAQAKSDYQRRQAALAGAVSGEELGHARDAVQAAKAAVNSARGGLAQAQSGIAGLDIAHNPDVLAAEAQLRAAALVLAHMKIVAPVDGVIAQRTVQVGQHVNAGAPLMAVVPLSDVWVDANFKEGQLARMRIGQPVRITTDLYGGKVVYHGHVAGLGAGSGSAFAVLPAQNASGNWIKIVQRVPVRIALDPAELKDNPLRVGLSVSADVDVSDQTGPRVADAAVTSVMRGDTGEDIGPQVDAMVARILAANGVRGR